MWAYYGAWPGQDVPADWSGKITLLRSASCPFGMSPTRPPRRVPARKSIFAAKALILSQRSGPPYVREI